ncbi:unnamed protein product [Rodentolepis nana]|uniref:Uncharacterized protein n=1 Tax=Rodentolepis nana TaxID=102285 RepID=A0A0R3T418_RODNA|nr:unnamed protein product [Rodentolepis nana]
MRQNVVFTTTTTITPNNNTSTITTAAVVDAAATVQGDASAIRGGGDVKATKYADMIGDVDDRRISRAARLTECKTRLNTSIARRNKHGELCFVMTVEGRRDSDVEKFKRLICD